MHDVTKEIGAGNSISKSDFKGSHAELKEIRIAQLQTREIQMISIGIETVLGSREKQGPPRRKYVIPIESNPNPYAKQVRRIFGYPARQRADGDPAAIRGATPPWDLREPRDGRAYTPRSLQ